METYYQNELKTFLQNNNNRLEYLSKETKFYKKELSLIKQLKYDANVFWDISQYNIVIFYVKKGICKKLIR